MKFSIKNLGKMQSADLKLNNLTVFCGQNNTNKTYLTYSLYSFFYFIKEKNYSLESLRENFRILLKASTVQISIEEIIDAIKESTSKDFLRVLPHKLAIRPNKYNPIDFSSSLIQTCINRKSSFRYAFTLFETEQFTFTKKAESDVITVVYSKIDINDIDNIYLKDKSNNSIYILILEQHFKAILDVELFKGIPMPYISSVERTGISVFEKELERNKNNFSSSISKVPSLERKYIYPQAVEDNIDFVKNIQELSKKTSRLAEERPDIIEYFSSIINGNFCINEKRGTTYNPSGTSEQLFLIESSSSIRALLDLSMYLNHVADKNQILIIDEPEMNLHPENQRKVARLLSMIVNYGIKVIVTTHSDFITREFSLLVMLSSKVRQDRLEQYEELRVENYETTQVLSPGDISVYSVFSEGNIARIKEEKVSSDEGVSITSFDDVIDKMNNIYSLLL